MISAVGAFRFRSDPLNPTANSWSCATSTRILPLDCSTHSSTFGRNSSTNRGWHDLGRVPPALPFRHDLDDRVLVLPATARVVLRARWRPGEVVDQSVTACPAGNNTLSLRADPRIACSGGCSRRRHVLSTRLTRLTWWTVDGRWGVSVPLATTEAVNDSAVKPPPSTPTTSAATCTLPQTSTVSGQGETDVLSFLCFGVGHRALSASTGSSDGGFRRCTRAVC